MKNAFAASTVPAYEYGAANHIPLMQRNTQQSQFYGSPATKWLLILNIVVFLIDVMGAEGLHRLTPYGSFVAGDFNSGGYTFHDSMRSLEWWKLLTFQFLHGNLFHLFANMLGIYMFAGIVERFLGTRRFIAYYLLCGIAGGLFFYTLAHLGIVNFGLIVGASAGVLGIVVALILIAPNMQVMLLFPPIPMKMKTLGILYLALAVFTIISRGNNAGGEAGHLGGMVIGFLLMKNPHWLNWVDRIGANQTITHRPRKSHQYKSKLRPRTHINLSSSEIDRILDKVNREGLHSLTEEERSTLKKVSEHTDDR